MIRNIFVIAFLFFSVFCYSQDKNKFLLGGDIGAMYSSNTINKLKINNNGSFLGGFTPSNLIGTIGDNAGDYKTFYFNVDQSILVYLTNKVLIGLEFSLLREINTYESDLIHRIDISSYLISPCFRYFIYQGFYGQTQLNLGLSGEKVKSDELPVAGPTGYYNYDYSTDINAYTNGFGISTGYLVPLGNCMNMELALKYVMNKSKFDYENISEDGIFDFTQNTVLFSLGFKYIIKRSTLKN